MLCTEKKTCNFDCAYCQLGPTLKLQTQRQDFVSLSKLADDLNAARGVAADWVTFSGMGEPTLAANLGAAISLTKSIVDIPVAVFTNAGLMTDENVRKDLSQADMVIVKLDAADEKSFKAINKPAEGINFGKMLQGLQMFRMEYKGKLAVDVMLSDMNKGTLYTLQYMTKLLMPEQVQVNTPVRPCAVKPLPAEELEPLCKKWFWNQKNVVTIYSGKRPEVTPIDAKEAEMRHPPLAADPADAATDTDSAKQS
jgi:wyosine [tRNA(Phe)-imidazoG37] synthetase (radical SAM superfamily)